VIRAHDTTEAGSVHRHDAAAPASSPASAWLRRRMFTLPAAARRRLQRRVLIVSCRRAEAGRLDTSAL